MEEITSALESKKYTSWVFIDLKKAFDTIDHNILISKLHTYGIRGMAQDWIGSFLKNRTAMCGINK